MRNICNKSVAYHEAGHAVAYWDLTGRAPILATIEPSIGYLGRVEYEGLIDDLHIDIDRSENARLRSEHSIMIKLAGLIAQKRYAGRSISDYASSPDWLAAVDFAIRLNNDTREAIACIGWLEYRTTDLIEHHWQLVRRVASALLRHKILGGVELQNILRVATLLLLIQFIPTRARVRNEVPSMIAPISVCYLVENQAVTCGSV